MTKMISVVCFFLIRKKNPELVDMPNVDTFLAYYFGQ